MRTFLYILSFVLIFSFPAQAMKTKAKQAYIIDFDTGQLLLGRQSNLQMPTSSMSKVMTAIMVFDAIENGDISMQTTFNISEKASKKGGSKMFVAQGTDVTVEDLLRGIIIQSGNDATIAVAEGLSGSEDAFAEQMTARAREIGMKDTKFANASGWPDPNHYSTAKDLATMSVFLIKNYPQYYEFYSEKEFEYAGIMQANRNPLLSKNFNADGIKTGHTEVAGYGLIGSATKDGRRVIMVLNGMESESERSAESQRLMQWALDSFENKKLLSEGQVITNAKVTMGKTETVALVGSDDVLATVKKRGSNQYKVTAGFKSPLIAPIKKGDTVGTILVEIEGRDDVMVPLLAAQNVEELGFFKKYIKKMKYHILSVM